MLGAKCYLLHAVLRMQCDMLGMQCAMMTLQFFIEDLRTYYDVALYKSTLLLLLEDEGFNIHNVFLMFDIRMKTLHITYSK